MSSPPIPNLDFVADYHKIVCQEMDSVGAKYTEGAGVTKNVIEFFDIANKLIPPGQYHINESKEFVAKSSNLESNHALALAEIEKRFQNGGALNPFLNKRSLDATLRDWLLDDWKIKHLHLNNERTKHDYFMDRSDMLLFVRVEGGDVYFIDIVSHNEPNVCAKQELLKVVYNNWPELIGPDVLKGTTTKAYTDQEIDQIRRAGGNLLLEIAPGVTIAPPGGGIVTSGTNVNHTRLADMTCDALTQLQSHVRRNWAGYESIFEMQNPSINLCFFSNNKFGLKEKTTGKTHYEPYTRN